MKKIIELIKLLINPKNWKNIYQERRELVLYFIFGVLTTAVSFAAYYILRFLFPDSDSVPNVFKWLFNLTAVFAVESNTAFPIVFSWIISVTFAYITNRVFVFNSTVRRIGVIKEAFMFYGARFGTLFLDVLIMFVLVDLTSINYAWYEFCARLFSSIFVLSANYMLSRIFIFPKKGLDK